MSLEDIYLVGFWTYYIAGTYIFVIRCCLIVGAHDYCNPLFLSSIGMFSADFVPLCWRRVLKREIYTRPRSNTSVVLLLPLCYDTHSYVAALVSHLEP